MFKSFLLALCLVLVPAFALGQEPNHRRHRHSKKVIKLVEAVGGPYIADAVDFDGSNDALSRSSDWIGSADGKTGTLSFWFRIDGTDGSAMFVGATTGTRNKFRRNSSDKLFIGAENSSGTTILGLTSTTTFTTSSTWHHALVSFDLSVPIAHMFIDGVDDEAGGSTETDDTIDYTTSDKSIGSNVSGGNKWDGCLAEIFFGTGFLDITQESNRLKFRSSDGKPVNLGTDGSTPTGSSPVVYLRGDSTNFEINSGTGGDLVVAGSLTVCSTSPSD